MSATAGTLNPTLSRRNRFERKAAADLMSTMRDPRSLSVPALWREPIAQWATWLSASGRSPNTIYTRTDHLRRTARATSPRGLAGGRGLPRARPATKNRPPGGSQRDRREDHEERDEERDEEDPASRGHGCGSEPCSARCGWSCAVSVALGCAGGAVASVRVFGFEFVECDEVAVVGGVVWVA